MRRAAAVVLALLSVTCTQTITVTGPDINVPINLGPTPSPSGSPGGSANCPKDGQATKPDSVKIAQFGESGCSNPSGAQRSVRVGCTAAITCSPLIGGQQAPTGCFPPDPDFFGLSASSNAVQVNPSGTTTYNLDVVGREPGTATFRCEINGVNNVQTAGSFTMTVVP